MTDKIELDKKPTIVIADSDAIARFYLRQAIETSFQVNIEEHRNGSSLIEQARRGYAFTPPKVIIIDLNLPLAPALEVLSFFSQHELLSPIPIIVITTGEALDSKQTILRYGAKKIIQKPTGLENYTDIISAVSMYLKPKE